LELEEARIEFSKWQRNMTSTPLAAPDKLLTDIKLSNELKEKEQYARDLEDDLGEFEDKTEEEDEGYRKRDNGDEKGSPRKRSKTGTEDDDNSSHEHEDARTDDDDVIVL